MFHMSRLVIRSQSTPTDAVMNKQLKISRVNQKYDDLYFYFHVSLNVIQ